MRKLLLLLLLPVFVQAQTPYSLNYPIINAGLNTNSVFNIKGYARIYGTTPGVAGTDSIVVISGGRLYKIPANSYAVYTGLQDSLTKKANRTFDNVAAGAIANVKLANSTISGISLGSNLAALTGGYGITSGGTYLGATTRTFAVDTAQIQTVLNFFPKADTRYVKLSGSYSNPSWITNLAISKIDGLQDSLDDRLNVLVPNGILSGRSGAFTGNPLMTFLNDSTITFRTYKLLHLALTSQNPGGTDYSTFLGYRAGESFLSGTQGYANTGIGRGALMSLQSSVASQASSNTAVGHNAGRFLSTTTGSSLFGTGAGDALTTNATSEGVVGMGWHVFNQSSSAYRSVSLGTSSSYQLNSVLPSAIVGFRGAFSSTTADYLAGVGANVFENNVTGDRKSALGGLAAQHSKGGRTVHIGTQSDSGTGDDLIMIGDFTRPSTWNASNEGNIGNVLLFKGVTVDSAQNSNAALGIGVNRANSIAGRRIESFIGIGGIASSADSIGHRTQVNYLANNDGYIGATSQIGFGYTTPSNTYVPAAIGMVTTNQGGNTFGDVFLATRNVSTDTKPTVGLWLRSGGVVQLPNLIGSVTDMVTIDNDGNLGRTAIPSGGGGGTVVSVGVNSANGFAGSSSGGVNPAITLTTTVTGILKGNGTTISAASAGDFPTLNQNTTGVADFANLAYGWDTYSGTAVATPTYLMAFNNTTSKYGYSTAAQVKPFLSLENVDNTADANKPVSTAQAASIAVVQSDIDTHEANVSNPHSVTKTQVGLSNVDNTSDAAKNAATATLTNKTLTSPVINSPTGIAKGDVGLGNVDNTSDTNKPVSTATQTALDLKENLSNKSTSTSLGTSNTLYPTQNAVKTYVDDKVGSMFRSGSHSSSVTSTCCFVIPFTTLPSTSYQVVVTPTSSLASTSTYYVTSKATGQFTVNFSPAMTGTVSFDWMIIHNP